MIARTDAIDADDAAATAEVDNEDADDAANAAAKDSVDAATAPVARFAIVTAAAVADGAPAAMAIEDTTEVTKTPLLEYIAMLCVRVVDAVQVVKSVVLARVQATVVTGAWNCKIGSVIVVVRVEAGDPPLAEIVMVCVTVADCVNRSFFRKSDTILS